MSYPISAHKDSNNKKSFLDSACFFCCLNVKIGKNNPHIRRLILTSYAGQSFYTKGGLHSSKNTIVAKKIGGNFMNIISTNNAPKAIGPYSQAIEANGTLYISGQIPLDPTTMELVSEDISAQTNQCLKSLQAILVEAGYSLENVVKCGIFLDDMNDFAAVNEVYGQYFSTHKPARACVEVARLPRDVKVEIEAIAVK